MKRRDGGREEGRDGGMEGGREERRDGGREKERRIYHYSKRENTTYCKCIPFKATCSVFEYILIYMNNHIL